MRIDIISCLPGLLTSPLSGSIIGRAQERGKVTIQLHDLRAWGVEGRVDDAPYGGGGGMVLMIAPVARCIAALSAERVYDQIIYMAPDGKLLKQELANWLSLQQNLIILCGHYKGVDERIREHLITMEISIGHYVLTGGELAAAVLVDALVRLLPGVLSDATSALTDSFQDGLIAPPLYTRPANFRGMAVPPVLCSGDALRIAEWRHEQALLRTQRGIH